MRHLGAVVCLLVSLMLTTAANIAEDHGTAISAENLQRLRPYDRIDFAGFNAKLKIGWFAANDDATEFVLFDQSGEIYGFSFSDESRRGLNRQEQSAQPFALIDGVQIQGEPIILHQLDGQYLINENRLKKGQVPIALFHGISEDDLFVEATDDDGQTHFLHYWLDRETGELSLQDVIPFPDRAGDAPAMRIGRINFPVVIVSALAESRLYFDIYPDSFSESGVKEFQLVNGPAVFGAVNAPAASHLAWTSPSRQQLNLLNLETGENRIVAALDGAYPQYLLLSKDASAILAVNLDFRPAVVGWNAESGERYDLGPYRECGRIPDKVELSRDGKALIIGCDTGLDIWRVFE
ncbi:MAG: hypothetical protein OXG60_18130 [Chloroflexi bacterium]|nr:hypothetical protein [Chloroflexota bacterium]